jgi:hypothetical protein
LLLKIVFDVVTCFVRKNAHSSTVGLPSRITPTSHTRLLHRERRYRDIRNNATLSIKSSETAYERTAYSKAVG